MRAGKAAQLEHISTSETHQLDSLLPCLDKKLDGGVYTRVFGNLFTNAGKYFPNPVNLIRIWIVITLFRYGFSTERNSVWC